MAFEHKNNTGSLFRNTRATNENHPSHTGQAKIDGVEYWISAWVKDGGKGKFFSMAFKPKDEQGGGHEPGQVNNRPSEQELEDEIPF